MQPYRVVSMKPAARQLQALRQSAGWAGLDERDIQKGLDGTLYAVCAFSGEEIVGSARVVGDGRTVFYIQDVIVLPEHRGRGVGSAMMEQIMEYVAKSACDGAVVGLMAAAGREPFYGHFGFHTRPNEREGAGMAQLFTTKRKG